VLEVFVRVVIRFALATGGGIVDVVDASGVAVVSVEIVGVVSVVVGGCGVTVGTGWVLAGASCAASWVEESAKTAAIAVAPARA
jgi:hypothetical protein